MSLYYKIWIDAIILAKKKAGKSGNWKLLTIIPMSAIQGINLFTLMLWARALSGKEVPVLLPMDIFNVRPFNSFLSIIIIFFIPFVILNYLLIFNNDRYNSLKKLYRGSGGKLYMIYIFISLGILGIPLILKWIFQ